MRMLGLFLGTARRNDPVELVDLRPVEDYGDTVISGNAGLDGCTILSRAAKNRQGLAPPVRGTLGPAYMGPAEDWEQ